MLRSSHKHTPEADLLLVDGDPLTDIKLLENPAKNLVVIMEDGKVYKDALRKQVAAGASSKESLVTHSEKLEGHGLTFNV